jgi:hypothetical protein
MAYKHTPDYLQDDPELQRGFEFSFGQRPGIPFTRHNDIVVCGVHHTCSLEQDEQADVYARTATPL